MKKIITTKDGIIFLSILLLCCILSLNLGNSLTNPFLNYHFYTPYAAMTGRIGVDILPADVQSYFNPYLDYPFYFIIKYLNPYPKLILFLNGIPTAIFLFIFFKLCDFLFKVKGLEKGLLLIFCLILAITSPILLNEFIPSNNDVPVAIAVISSLLLLFKQVFKVGSKKRTLYIIASGLLMGMITGLKLVASLYCFSLFITLLCMHKEIGKPIKTILLFSVSIILGFLITDGYWMYLIYSHFKNPFFPYFNNIFHSPYADYNAIIDSDYQILKPKNIFEFIFFPFLNLCGKSMKGYERQFYDLRYPLTYILIPILALLYKAKGHEKLINSKQVLFLLIFISSSYFIGMLIFAQYRYFLILNALTSILIIILLYSVIKSKLIIYFLMTIFLIFFFNTTIYIKHYIIRPPNIQKMLEIEDMKIKDNALVLETSHTAGIIIPFQNPKAKYALLTLPKKIKIKSSYYFDFQYYHSGYVERELKKHINQNKNNLYIIKKTEVSKIDGYLYDEALKEYTNNKFEGYYDCKDIKNNIYNYDNSSLLCKIKVR